MQRITPLCALATSLYLLPLLVILAGQLLGPENWWLTGFNLYIPQWIWLVPLILLFPLYLFTARKWLWVPILLLCLVIGPIMGLCYHFLPSVSPSGKGIRLRVMTYNIKWAKKDVRAIENDINKNQPDLILMQDSGGVLMGEMGRFLKDFNIQSTGQYVIASRMSLSNEEIRWISFPDQTHRVLRCILRAQGRQIAVYDCHLESPRFGLSAMRHPRSGIATLEANIALRVKESKRLADFVKQETLPVLLTGDLNAPVQAVVCSNLFEVGLRDAFSSAGSGYGYTYGLTTKVGMSYVRLDHIMTSPQWQVLRCWTGNETGSDHCPVFADIFLPDKG